jgi:hypothetical protein
LALQSSVDADLALSESTPAGERYGDNKTISVIVPESPFTAKKIGGREAFASPR